MVATELLSYILSYLLETTNKYSSKLSLTFWAEVFYQKEEM